MTKHRHTVLCVDDEKQILSSLKRLLRREKFNLLTTSNCEEALELLEEHDIHLIISDQRMPQMSGTEFLSIVKERYPDTIRIVLSGYTQVDTIRNAINQGNIYKLILKPWDDDNLKNEIEKSLVQYDLIQANQALNDTIVEKNRQLEHINKNLEDLVGSRTRELELRNAALELSRALFEGIPAPVLGLSMDGAIMLINRNAQTLDIGRLKFCVGKSIFDYFPEGIKSLVRPVFDSRIETMTLSETIKGSDYVLTFSSMSGRYEGKGVILFFHPRLS